jgi:hypothetical protein
MGLGTVCALALSDVGVLHAGWRNAAQLHALHKANRLLTSISDLLSHSLTPFYDIRRIDRSHLQRCVQDHYPRRALPLCRSIASSAKPRNTGNVQCDFLYGHRHCETCSTLTEMLCLILRALIDRLHCTCGAHIGRITSRIELSIHDETHDVLKACTV